LAIERSDYCEVSRTLAQRLTPNRVRTLVADLVRGRNQGGKRSSACQRLASHVSVNIIEQRSASGVGESPGDRMEIAAVAYLMVVALMSLVCFIAYGLDKRQAANGGRRVSERTLHLMAFLGGWPGALLGQRQFRHKTQKVAFPMVFWMVVVLHIGIVGAVAYALGRWAP